MSGAGPPGDKWAKKFTEASTERFGKWAEQASDEDFDLASQALLRVVDGTWWDEYAHCRSAIHTLTWDILLKPGLIMTVRFVRDYPNIAQLIYIGPSWDAFAHH
jgi:hypothetical protein